MLCVTILLGFLSFFLFFLLAANKADHYSLSADQRRGDAGGFIGRYAPVRS